MNKQTKTLTIYHNDNDYIVAESAEDAIKIWNAYIGDDWVEGLHGTEDDWILISGGERLSIIQEYEPRIEDIPRQGATNKAKHGLWVVTAKAHSWLELNGRGWLYSLDW